MSKSPNKLTFTNDLSETESELISLSKWAIISLKIPGYFPFDIVKFINPHQSFILKYPGPKLVVPYSHVQSFEILQFFAWNSNSTTLYKLYVIICGILSLCLSLWSAYAGFYHLIKNKNIEQNVQQVFSEDSDRILSTVNLFLMIAIFLIFRLYFLINRKKLLELWKKTVELMLKFKIQGLFYCENIQELKILIRSDAIWLWTNVLVQLGISVVLTVQLHLAREEIFNWTWLISVNINLIIINCHIGLTVWLGFFIKLYTHCFKTVRDEIKHVACGNKTNVPLLSSRDKIALTFTKAFPTTVQSQCELEDILELFELTSESVDRFNSFMGISLMVDICTGLGSALMSVYTLNKLFYESGKQSWDNTLIDVVKFPLYFFYVVRLFFLINGSDSMTQNVMEVLRQLQRIPQAILRKEGPEIQTKIQILVTRTSLNPPRISPGNYFGLSRPVLASIVSIMATYYVLLTELREEDEGRTLLKSVFNLTGTSSAIRHQ